METDLFFAHVGRHTLIPDSCQHTLGKAIKSVAINPANDYDQIVLRIDPYAVDTRSCMIVVVRRGAGEKLTVGVETPVHETVRAAHSGCRRQINPRVRDKLLARPVP